MTPPKKKDLDLLGHAVPKYDDRLVEEEEERIIQAKCFMQKHIPFMYFLVAKLNVQPWPQDPKIIIPGWEKNREIDPNKQKTACVDARGNLFWNPHFTKTLTISQLAAVFSHEVMHVAFMHMARLGGRDRMVANWAADAKVNAIIRDLPYIKLPENLIVPDSNHTLTLKYIQDIVVKECDKKSYENIYDEIMDQIRKQEKKNGKGQGSGQGTVLTGKNGESQFDSHTYNDADGQGEGKDQKEGEGESGNGTGQHMSDSEIEKAARDWRANIAHAAAIARQRGTLPGSLEALIDGLLNPILPWKSLLRKYMTSVMFADYTWSRPSKRSLAIGCYLPGTVKEGIDVIVAIDTSGSIGDDELVRFMTEVQSIGNSFENVTMTAIVCDAQVQDTFNLGTADAKVAASRIKLSGRGGTSHVPVAKWIKKNKPQAKVTICFTDMATEFPEKKDKPGRWIWVATANYGTEDQCPEGDVFIKMTE